MHTRSLLFVSAIIGVSSALTQAVGAGDGVPLAIEGTDAPLPRGSLSGTIEYHLTVGAAGYHDAEAFTPLVSELKPVEAIVIRLRKKLKGTVSDVARQTISGTVTRDGKPVKVGWVGLWRLAGDGNETNVDILRGRTVSARPTVCASATIYEGQYRLDVPYQDDAWYLAVEEPDQALTQIGPVSIGLNETQRRDIVCGKAGGISGRLKNVPSDWQGQLWIVAFTRTGVWLETRADEEGRFSFALLPPGEYGLKVGHDAYHDSEVPQPSDDAERWKKAFETNANPWKRAAVVQVEPGQVTEGVELELPL